MKNRIVIVIILSLLFGACKTNKQSFQAASEYEVDVTQRSTASEFFDDYKYVMLESNDSTLITEIKGIDLTDSLIAVHSGETVFVFDMEGKIEGKIDKRGQGPQEYLGISDFMIDGDDIWILSSDNMKFLVYDKVGNFKKDLALDDSFHSFIFKGEDEILMSADNCNRGGYNFKIVDKKTGEVKEKYDRFDFNQSVIIYGFTPFLGSDENGEFYVTHPFDMNVYSLNDTILEKKHSYKFNTEMQLTDEYPDVKFYDALNETNNKPVVQFLSMYIKNGDEEIMSFPLFGEYGLVENLVKFKSGKQTAFLAIMEELDEMYPYVSDPKKLYKGNIVSALNAQSILYIEENNGLDKFTKAGLTEDDNPVIFFHHLKK